MHRREVIFFLAVFVCATICLYSCFTSDENTEVEDTEAATSETNPCAKVLKENTGAEECLISFSDHNSLDQPLQTVQIEIVNPKTNFEAMALWRFASLAALQYMAIMNRDDFLSDQFIEIKRTHAWDETLIDSSKSRLTGFSTKYVVLADSFYNVAISILDNVDGRGFINARNEIDIALPDSLLLEFDSGRLIDEGNLGRPQDWSAGGFTQSLLDNGDTILNVHVLERTARLMVDHTFLFSTKTGKIIWWEEAEYDPNK